MPRSSFLLAGYSLTMVVTADTPTIPAIDFTGLINLLLGPVGLTVGAVFVVWQFASDHWLTASRSDKQAQKVEDFWRERWQEMKGDRDTAMDMAEKAVAGYTSVAEAVRERNNLDTQRLQSLAAGDQESAEEEPPPTKRTPTRAPARAARLTQQKPNSSPTRRSGGDSKPSRKT